MEFPPNAPDAPKAPPPSDGDSGPTNDPRPLGGRERSQERYEKWPTEEEGQPTNDPRPLGGASLPPATEKRQEQAKLSESLRDPVKEAEGVAADAPDAAAGAGRLALVSSAAGAAADVLRTAHDKASSAAAAAASAASGALEAGKAVFAGDVAEAPPRHVDEVDLSPEEQLTRHRVELDPEKLHHWTPPHQEGPIARAKHAAESVVHKVEHLLPGGGGGAEQRGASEAAPITLQGLKFKEPMHMAKNTEGSNAVDEKGRLVAQGTSATAGGTGSGSGEGVIQFPETLQQAIEGISEEPEASPAAQREEEDDVSKKAGGDPQEGHEPEPFGVTSGARSKL